MWWSLADAVETSLDSSMTEWERGREREEFVRAALLYKPSNSSLSSRFTRAKHEDDTDSVEVTQEQEVRSSSLNLYRLFLALLSGFNQL